MLSATQQTTSNSAITKDASAVRLTPKEFVEQEEGLSTIALRERAVRFLFCSYGGLLFGTFIIIILQGFHFWGFSLESGFLHWLGGATLAEVAGLAVIVYKFLFTRFSTPP